MTNSLEIIIFYRFFSSVRSSSLAVSSLSDAKVQNKAQQQQQQQQFEYDEPQSEWMTKCWMRAVKIRNEKYGKRRATTT